MKIHTKYMMRCIEMAKNGLGNVAPNPMVGCVIVNGSNIIGEGYTSAYGGNHAEVNAIESVKDKSLLEKSRLYVTLEPCSHYGKTPPCTDLILKHKIPEIYIGTKDINVVVSGNGIKILKEAGCKVYVGLLERECKQHHKRFFTFHYKKRPYIILKWAQTADGFIAPSHKETNKPFWLSNDRSRQLVHKWRTEEQAILVGTNTVVEDNPKLTSRDWYGKNPIRVVLDRAGRLTKTSSIFNNDAKTIVVTTKSNTVFHNTSTLNVEVIDWSLKTEISSQICEILYKYKISSIIIEGGQKTLQTFIDENMWDEARIFTSQKTLISGIKAPKINTKFTSNYNILTDTLNILINDKNTDF